MKKHSGLQRLLSVVLTLALVCGVLPAYAVAADNDTVTSMVADPGTVDTYETMLGTDSDGNRYAGRIWTDKSVYEGTGSENIDGIADIAYDDDEFLVVYSTLGSTTSVTTETVVRGDLDVVVVIDNSVSMSSTASGTNSTRQKLVVDAANDLIYELLADSSNRLSVVTYGADAMTILPLNSYYQTDTCLTISSSSSSGRPGQSGQQSRGVITASATIYGTSTKAGISDRGFYSGTNQQSGINEAMKILNGANDTNGRIPVVIVLSDGAANTAAATNMIGDVSDVDTVQSSGQMSAGIALSTLLNAAYWKYIVGEKYNADAVVFTVGVDIPSSDAADAKVVMNPKEAFHSGNSTTNVGRTAYAWYLEWVNSKVAEGQTAYSITESRINWSFPQPDANTKAGIINNINYVDQYYSVSSSTLADAFDSILTTISSTQSAFQAITDTVVTEGDTPQTYVDFIGDYMEVNEFKGVTLYGKFYAVSLAKTTSVTENGTTTVTYEYVVGEGSDPITDPMTKERFQISDVIDIELIHTYDVDEAGNRISAGEQEVWIRIMEEAMPLIYHAVASKDGKTTYTVYEEDPMRVYYTVGISEYVAPSGNILLHRVDEAYLAANTDPVTGEVYFYSNQYYAQADETDKIHHTAESGYGDTHTSATPDEKNRYYYHQYNYPLYTSVTNADGSAVEWDETEYGVKDDGTYVTTVMDFSAFQSMQDNAQVYTNVTYHVPTGNGETTENGGVQYSGEQVTYIVYTTWGELKNSVTFYDAVNGVYINSDGTTSDTGVYEETDNYDYVTAYINSTSNVTAADIQVILGIGSWRAPRLNNMTFAKTENTTETATLRVAPVLDTESEHEGSMVAWLGNNGRLGVTPVVPKTVFDSNGNNIDGRMVMIGDVLTYQVQATNYETSAATITITDTVPAGTEYVSGSATQNGVYSAETGTVTWIIEDVPMDGTVTVSFQVTVTEAALDSINNTAYVRINDDPAYETNTTTNPPVGKVSSVVDAAPNGELQVGSVLTYTIYYHNDADTTSVITISDTIPAGTTYVANSASYSGTDVLTETAGVNGNVTGLTWVIPSVPAGASGSVTFRAYVSASAVSPIENTASIQIGENAPEIITNTAVDQRAFGDLTLTKTVAKGNAEGSSDKYFTLVLYCGVADVSALNGTFTVSGSSKATEVTFEDGYAYLEIKDGETITVEDLPAGATVSVYEQAAYGYTATYSTDSIRIVADNTAQIDVTNTYYVSPTGVALEGTKELTGRTMEEGEFDFLVYENGSVVTNGTNDADGNIIFNPITYSAPGVHTYTIVEENDAIKGIHYDDSTFTVTVTVTDNGDGTLTATVNDPEGGVVFHNTYTPEEVELTLTGTKFLTGGGADGLTAGEFSFSIYESDSTGTVGNLVTSGINGAGTSSAAITFTAVGIGLDDMKDTSGNILSSQNFYYLVMEDIPASDGPTYDPNMYYDQTAYLVKVTVNYSTDGILSIAGVEYTNLADGESANAADFTNIQNPDSVEVVPVGVKTTDDAPDGVTFSFSVVNQNTGKTESVGVGAANGSIAFNNLSYPETGTYVYTVKESNVDNTTNGITYDKTVYIMTVVVTRDSTNKLVAEVTYTDVEGNTVQQPSFHNVYDAKGHINITAAKELEGRDLKDGEFAFRLTRTDNGGEIDGIASADGTIEFATMYYSMADIPEGQDSATIHYVMSEVVPESKLPGVTYDASEYDVYVTIVDNDDGTITAFLSDEDGNPLNSATQTGVVFKNTYTVTTGTEVTIEATKILNGRQLKNEEFAFTLYRYDAVNDTWLNIGSALNDADGSISFTRYYNAATLNQLAFDEDDTYTVLYRIDEDNNKLGGITYDGDSIYVKVVVAHDAETASYSVQSVGYYGDADCTMEVKAEFVNTYKTTSATYTPAATKVLTGREMEDNEFIFVVADETNTPVSVGRSKSDGTIVFDTINYTSAGTYKYTMYEVNGDLGGVTYSTQRYTFTVTVTDDGNGSLVATSDLNAVEFVNTYSTEPVDVQLTATKTLSGKALAAGDFTFVLTDEEGDEITATNKADGSITFDKLTFDKVGTYTYSIHEVKGNDSRYTYDTTVYSVIVEVKDDGNGNLYASVTYLRNNTEVGAVSFYNSYVAAPVTLDLNDKIDFSKTVESTSGGSYSLAGFRFEVYNWSGALVASGVSDDIGYIDFEDDLVFNLAGDYRFQVVEIAEDEAGMAYDSTVWVVHVTVAYDNITGLLSITEVHAHELSPVSAIDDGESDDDHDGNAVVEFVNIYDPEDVTLEITVGKNLTGRDLKDGEFRFQLLSGNAVVDEATNDADGNVTFQVTYDQVGGYIYTVREVKGSLGGVTYDEKGYSVTVEVTDNDGVLAANVISEAVTFENTYAAQPVSINLSANKVLHGRDINAGEFTFVLTDENGKTYTATNDANGEVVFESLTFTEVGTHTYTVTERAGELGGVTYSNMVYTATVTVTDDGVGQLHAAVRYTYTDSNENEQSVAAPLFYNIYEAAPVEITLEATKALSGRELQDGEFTFVLTDEDGNETTVTNNADGTVSFGSFEYTEVGTYAYTLTESAGDKGGVGYDDTEYTVTVVISDDLEGNLVATVTVDGTPVAADENAVYDLATFNNTYGADPVEITLEAVKALTGRDLNDGEFTFVLTDGDGNETTVTNNADGTVSFGAIKYTAAGTYVYTLTEAAGELGGVTYDETEYTVTVYVTDDLEGSLVATVVVGDTNIIAADGVYTLATFNNSYAPASVEAEIEASKTLTGRDLTDGEFTFVLTDEEGSEITATNDADGKILFSVEYTEAGTYVYTLTEAAGELGGVTYDETEYTVTVRVTDDLEGSLVAEVTVEGGSELVFTNSYEAAPVEISLEANKTLTGRDLAEGEFTFLLTDEAGDGFPTTNAADGSVVFDLVFDQTDIYEYTVSELSGDAENVTYDSSVYTVVITVADDGEGSLYIASVTVNDTALNLSGTAFDTGITFVNEYEEPEVPTDPTDSEETDPTTGDGTPQTGDESNMLLTGMLLLGSLVALAALLLGKKKEWLK